MLRTTMRGTYDALRLLPLGGLGEVGMNCLALEQGDDVIVIDCGVTFPGDGLGVELEHPRFDWLLERRDRVRGIVITHGHEDHIGALPFLLEELDAPVYGPSHALALIRRRLAEHGFAANAVELVTTRPREPFELGSFEIEPIRVTHSIVEATALAIDTCAGLVIHTGDFKLDPTPADGECTDEARLGELGAQGVRLLLSDSTNIDSHGTSASELVVGEELEAIVAESTERVIVGMFASNVQRLLHVGRIAQRTGRKLCLLGRSATTHVEVATQTRWLGWPSDLVVSPEAAARLPRDRVLGVATGTQAEPLAALSRLARGQHPKLRLDPGDRVVFSSRIIPGNDRAVFDLYAAFLRAGIEVVSRAQRPKVHASGHAHRDEQRRMIELTKPASFLPVHGTLHHLSRHAELARSLGVADVLVAENGHVVSIGAERALRKDGEVPVGRVSIAAGEPVPQEALAERAQLKQTGVAFVAVPERVDGSLVGRIDVRCAGVLGPLEGDVLAKAGRAAEHAHADARRRTPDERSEAVRLATRRAIEAEIGQRPTVLVSVVRCDG
jgi:ribonuclease J